VEEGDKGFMVAWIDNSPEALRRQDAIRRKERQDRGDEEREHALINEQVRKAKLDAQGRSKVDDEDEKEHELKRAEGEKIKLSFGAKSERPTAASEPSGRESSEKAQASSSEPVAAVSPTDHTPEGISTESTAEVLASDSAPPSSGKISMKVNVQSKPKNVFAVAKKNAFGGKKASVIEQPKKMSEAERIMKEELERKRSREASGFGGSAQKRQKF